MEQTRTSSSSGLLAVLLVVVHVGLDLVLALPALLVAVSSAHEDVAQTMLMMLVVVWLALLAVSTVLAVSDRSAGRRSPANWAGVGVLASAAASFLYFGVVSALGPAHGA